MNNIILVAFLLMIVIFFMKSQTRNSEPFNGSSPPIHPLKTEAGKSKDCPPTMYPTFGVVRPTFGVVWGTGKQVPSYGADGVLTVHPSQYQFQEQYNKVSKLIYRLTEKMRHGKALSIPESLKLANAKHEFNKLQGYKKPYFY